MQLTRSGDPPGVIPHAFWFSDLDPGFPADIFLPPWFFQRKRYTMPPETRPLSPLKKVVLM